MPRYAVGTYNLHDGQLKIEIVTADTWAAAVQKHSMAGTWDWHTCDTLESAKRAAFDCDGGLDVVEVPEC